MSHSAPQLTPIQAQINLMEETLAKPLPAIPALRAEITRLTTMAAADGSPASRTELKLACDALQHAELLHEERQKDLKTLERLRSERQAELAAERAARIKEATARLDQANQEFDAVAKQLCRAFQRCLDVSRENMAQGYGFPTQVPGPFTLPDMVPMTWQGTTDQHIREGSLRWLREEYEPRKVA